MINIMTEESKSNPNKIESILVIGSAVAETYLNIEKDLIVGAKHFADRYELLGGSGLNYTMRLISAGHFALPVLPIGRDSIGRMIKEEIMLLYKKTFRDARILDIIQSDDFFCEGLVSPMSTVIVSTGSRTIFTQKVYSNVFHNYLFNRINNICSNDMFSINAVLIGHIHHDNPEINHVSPAQTTKYILTLFKGKAIIYANFGESQICLGHLFWKDYLKCIDIFQLSLSEAKEFFKSNKSISTLKDILTWFMSNDITSIITLGEKGAVATFKGLKGKVVICNPVNMSSVVDTTGAGDAFSAGMVASLYRKKIIILSDFIEAMNVARLWSAYACMSMGAARDCPDVMTLCRFRDKFTENKKTSVVVSDLKCFNYID